MSISPAAWDALHAAASQSRSRASFLSILDWQSAWLESRALPYTPSVSEIYALESVLQQALDIGMESIPPAGTSRSRTRAALGSRRLGLELWPVREEIAAAACATAIKFLPGLDDKALIGTMRQKYGVAISPGYGELNGKLFRLGHMGPAQVHPTVLAAQLAVLERSLADLGYPVQLGAGVGAAMAELGTWNDAA